MTKQLIAEIENPNWVRKFVWSNDSSLVAFQSGETIHIHARANPTQPGIKVALEGSWSFRFHPQDNRLFVGRGNGLIEIICAQTGNSLGQIATRVKHKTVKQMEFNASGTSMVVSFLSSNTIQLWDIADTPFLESEIEAGFEVVRMFFAPNGDDLYLLKLGDAELWSVRPTKPQSLKLVKKAKSLFTSQPLLRADWLDDCALHDSQLLRVYKQHTGSVDVWKGLSGAHYQNFICPDFSVSKWLAFVVCLLIGSGPKFIYTETEARLSRDGENLFIVANQQMSVWNISTTRMLRSFPFDAEYFEISPSKREIAVVTSEPAAVSIWDIGDLDASDGTQTLSA